MDFDTAIEKIQNCDDISGVKDIIKKTDKYDREAVTDMARVNGWKV